MDAAAYRPKEEVEARWRLDPIARVEELLRQAGLSEGAIEAQRRAANAELERAYADALAAPLPDNARAFADVQDVGDPRGEAF
jgi:pyruvate dehydrogenase E1 component alpha subunit